MREEEVRNVFLPTFEGITLQEARRRSFKRKALEAFVSVIVTSRASKDDILEMYLNNVPLGQRGSFAVFGVAEASKLFFGKDVSNLSLAEAATIAGVIQQPSALSPFSNAICSEFSRTRTRLKRKSASRRCWLKSRLTSGEPIHCVSAVPMMA